jgi:hypothetical protein
MMAGAQSKRVPTWGFLLLLLLGSVTFPVWAQTEKDCAAQIAGSQTELVLVLKPSPELRAFVKATLQQQPFYRRLFHFSTGRTAYRLARAIGEVCGEAKECNREEIRRAAQRVLDRDWWNFKTSPGKLAVFTVHVGSIIGMSAGAAWLSDYFGLPKPVSTGIGAGAGLITNSVFQEWGEFWMVWVKGVNRNLAARLWKPREDDTWGNDRKHFNEQDNVKNNKTMNADILIAWQLSAAKEAMEAGDEAQALDIFSNFANSLHENLRAIHSEAPEISRYVDTFFAHRVAVPSGFGRRAYRRALKEKKISEEARKHSERATYLKSLFQTWFPDDF